MAQEAAVVLLAVLPVLLLELVVDLAHKPLLGLALQVVAVPVPLPQQPEVAAVVASLLVQGLVASETRLHSR